MVDIRDHPIAVPSGRGFAEHEVDADPFRLRYLEAGHGPPLVHLHGADGARPTRALDLLAERFRVISIDPPGFGRPPTGEHTRPTQDLAGTIADAVGTLGLGRYNLLGSSFGGTLALWLAVQFAERVEALVLESPTAIRPQSHVPVSTPRLEAVAAGPDDPGRDPELERRLAALQVPVLVLLGTADHVVPPEMGRIYRELLPNCHFVLVYNAAHAIGADRPEAFAYLVSDFLERRDQFVVTRASGLLHP